MAFLDSLDDEGLKREVKLGEKTETIGESINLHLVIHLNGHRGEVNLLRGMQGFDPVLLTRAAKRDKKPEHQGISEWRSDMQYSRPRHFGGLTNGT